MNRSIISVNSHNGKVAQRGLVIESRERLGFFVGDREDERCPGLLRSQFTLLEPLRLPSRFDFMIRLQPRGTKRSPSPDLMSPLKNDTEQGYHPGNKTPVLHQNNEDNKPFDISRARIKPRRHDLAMAFPVVEGAAVPSALANKFATDNDNATSFEPDGFQYLFDYLRQAGPASRPSFSSRTPNLAKEEKKDLDSP